ncbi:hypothetical protein DACRYDRAFT_99761 [Dacryopinax primogenitus]|uniref:Uncharacterized protein n=1 Tax=Dacryopinax primogenitus (strain DJM 731) TaxID=1858805 RepID=M5GDW3_DACPD|nr:uncharacterized protein DACRYDRAFT_99761 [Dacryopinax primogenitus]EJU02743.1 hypothetical protein DACRYDRAFT_99761 [Dacryopinax primogenitus]
MIIEEDPIKHIAKGSLTEEADTTASDLADHDVAPPTYEEVLASTSGSVDAPSTSAASSSSSTSSSSFPPPPQRRPVEKVLPREGMNSYPPPPRSPPFAGPSSPSPTASTSTLNTLQSALGSVANAVAQHYAAKHMYEQQRREERWARREQRWERRAARRDMRHAQWEALVNGVAGPEEGPSAVYGRQQGHGPGPQRPGYVPSPPQAPHAPYGASSPPAPYAPYGSQAQRNGCPLQRGSPFAPPQGPPPEGPSWRGEPRRGDAQGVQPYNVVGNNPPSSKGM